MSVRLPTSTDTVAGARPVSRRLRADAERNRTAILTAAQEVFAEQGLKAPLEEIAARAGVGIATLYRRFPDRQQLVAAALTGKLTQYAEAAGHALAVVDPWAGFASFAEQVCEMQADDRGLSDLLCMTLPAGEHVEQLRRQANDQVVELIDRAKAAGELRADFVGEDLLLLLIASAAIVRVTRHDAPHTWRRFVALMLDAFRQHDAPALPRPPSTAQMAQGHAQAGLGTRLRPTGDRVAGNEVPGAATAAVTWPQSPLPLSARRARPQS